MVRVKRLYHVAHERGGVYGQIKNASVFLHVAVVQDDGAAEAVVLGRHDVPQGGMPFVVFPRFNLDVDDEVKLTQLLRLKIVRRDTLGDERLSYVVLVYGAVIGHFPRQGLAHRVHSACTSEQTDVVHEQFEQGRIARKNKRVARLVDVISGNGNPCVDQPKKAVFLPYYADVLPQTGSHIALVLAV